jgi:hypothetical protein
MNVVMGLIADLSEQKIMPEAFRAKYDEALLAHHNRTGPFEWPEYDAGHAAHAVITIASRSSRLETNVLGKSCRRTLYALCLCA